MSRWAACRISGCDAARRSLAQARQRCREAIAITEAYGWATEPIAPMALATMGAADAGRAGSRRHAVAGSRRARAPGGTEPATALLVHFVRGELHVGEGRLGGGGRRVPRRGAAPGRAGHPARADRPGQGIDRADPAADGRRGGARATVAGLTERDHESAEARTALAALRLAEGDLGRPSRHSRRCSTGQRRGRVDGHQGARAGRGRA